jgi:hypothetical protein
MQVLLATLHSNAEPRHSDQEYGQSEISLPFVIEKSGRFCPTIVLWVRVHTMLSSSVSPGFPLDMRLHLSSFTLPKNQTSPEGPTTSYFILYWMVGWCTAEDKGTIIVMSVRFVQLAKPIDSLWRGFSEAEAGQERAICGAKQNTECSS